MIRKIRRVGTALWKALAWGALALWFDGPAATRLAGGLALAFATGCVAFVVVLRPL